MRTKWIIVRINKKTSEVNGFWIRGLETTMNINLATDFVGEINGMTPFQYADKLSSVDKINLYKVLEFTI